MFQFEDMTTFLEMGNHGPFVWGAYAMTLVVMVWLVVAPLRRSRSVLRKVRSLQRRTPEQQSPLQLSPQQHSPRQQQTQEPL